KAVIEHYQPDAVLVGLSVGFTIEKALIDAARRANIPVAAAVDHYWNLWQCFAGASPDQRSRYLPDTVFVPDEWCRRRLLNLGCPTPTIVTFRHPLLWTELEPANSTLRETVRRRLGLSRETLIVLFVSEYGFADADVWQWDQPPDAAIVAA